MRINSLKTLNLILSLSKDEAKISGFFSIPLKEALVAFANRRRYIAWGVSRRIIL
jgi:hypothetical protein